MPAWLAGDAIGERLGRHELSRIHVRLSALESFSQQIALTLHRQGICPDAPPVPSDSQHHAETRIELLRNQLMVQAACVDVAIAQSQRETLQMETATLQLMERKRALTAGFVADALDYRSHSHRASIKALR